MKFREKYINHITNKALFATLLIMLINAISLFAYAEDAKVNAKLRNEAGENDFFKKEDKEPQIDLGRLTKLVEYPELARKASAEGVVVVRVFINSEGDATKVTVEHSDNSLLNEAAINAVKKYGKMHPAYLDGKPVESWVSIPIRFRLASGKSLSTKDYLNVVKRVLGFLLFKN